MPTATAESELARQGYVLFACRGCGKETGFTRGWMGVGTVCRLVIYESGKRLGRGGLLLEEIEDIEAGKGAGVIFIGTDLGKICVSLIKGSMWVCTVLQVGMVKTFCLLGIGILLILIYTSINRNNVQNASCKNI